MQKKDPIDVLQAQVELGKADIFSVVEELSETKPGEVDQIQRTLRIERQDLPAPSPTMPTRAESMARAHTFNHIDDLAAYLKAYGHKPESKKEDCNIVALIDLNKQEIIAVLDELAPNGVELLRYKPIEAVEFSRFRSLLDKNLKPREFSKAMRELRPFVGDQGGAVSGIAGRLSVARTVEQHDSTGTDGTFGHVVRIQARRDGEPLTIPDRINVLMRPFVDSRQEIELECFIDLEPIKGDDSDVVAFQLSCPELGAIFQHGMVEHRIRLLKGMGRGHVAYGAMTRAEWSYQQ